MKDLIVRKELYCFLFLLILVISFFWFWEIREKPKKVEVVNKGAGQWEMRVDGNPYFIKGVVFNFSVIGDDPDRNPHDMGKTGDQGRAVKRLEFAEF